MQTPPGVEYALAYWGPVASVVVGLLYFERRLSRVEATLRVIAQFCRVQNCGKDESDE